MSDSTTAANLPSSTLEGPRVARPEDMPGIVTLANLVFRPAPRPGDMGQEFPILLSEQNADHLYIIRDASRVVSHVGVLRQTMHTCGLDIPVACIGAVCTDPEYRKAGLAGQLMDLAIQRAVAAGDLLMPISGKRTLYVSRGATSLGPQVRLKVPIQPDLPGRDDFTVCAYELADWPALAAMQSREPIRYQWSDSQPRILDAIRRFGGICLLASRADGQPAAALLFCVDHPMYGGKDGSGRVVQFLGDSQAVPALLAHAAGRCSLKDMDWHVMTTASPTLTAALLALGATGKSQITGWTVLILNLAKLVEKLAPVLVRTGVDLSARDGRLTVAAEGQSITLTQPDLQVELLFRGAATWSRPLLEMPPSLRIACAAALPVPLPDYGINYV